LPLPFSSSAPAHTAAHETWLIVSKRLCALVTWLMDTARESPDEAATGCSSSTVCDSRARCLNVTHHMLASRKRIGESLRSYEPRICMECSAPITVLLGSMHARGSTLRSPAASSGAANMAKAMRAILTLRILANVRDWRYSCARKCIPARLTPSAD
jgi:hypothetical protein